MKRIILFRFHKDVDICADRVRLLQQLNPAVEIYGLFGGKESELDRARKALRPRLEDIYCIRGKSSYWKRMHGDLAMGLWYRDVGKTLVFDTLHCVEWDLLLFDSLEEIFGHIPADGVGLTSLTPLREVERDWYWLSRWALRRQWRRLLGVAKARYGYHQEPFACEFPGACVPRGLLEAYSKADVPQVSHDELRMPLFSQIFGLKLYNTGLTRRSWAESEARFFNCDNREVRLSTMAEELAQSAGRRAFHPVRKVLPPWLLPP
jgi:hypothetical protein